MSFASVAISQELSFPFNDAQAIFKNEKECDLDRRELELRKQQDELKDQRIANLEKELALAQQELALKDRIIEIDNMEIQATRRALTDMTQVADRSMKLAETAKPKSNTLLYVIGGVLAGLVTGLLIAL